MIQTGFNLQNGSDINTLYGFSETVGSHNGRFRGESIQDVLGGTSLADTINKLSVKVKAHDYSNLFIGDYIDVPFTHEWGTETVRWVIACFDYYLNTGNVEEIRPHIVFIAEDCFEKQQVMNDTNTTEGGYVSSKMHTTILPKYSDALATAIGADHVLTFKDLLTNMVKTTTPSMAGAGWTGATTGWDWYDVRLNLMSEVQVYGSTLFSSSFYDVGNKNLQFPYFQLAPHKRIAHRGRTSERDSWWLGAVADGTGFANVGGYGNANGTLASFEWICVRPHFLFS